MFETPQAAHEWLQQFVGEWTVESNCSMGPEQPNEQNLGQLSCRLLGGLWLIGEGTSAGGEEEAIQTILTLGYDTRKEQYVGTFVASMMTHLWPYHGVLENDGKKLALHSEGPRFDGNGTTQYCDTIEIIDNNHWMFTGDVLGDDGQWIRIMTSHHRRA